MTSPTLLPGMTFPPISWWVNAIQLERIEVAENEHWAKQSFRNRYVIDGPNHLQKLVIPVHRPPGSSGKKSIMGEILVAYEEDWQRIHLKTLESTYRKSPFYDYYIDQLSAILMSGEKRLADLNLRTIQWGARVLETDVPVISSLADCEQREMGEKRQNMSHLENQTTYFQVFDERHGFLPNLSVLDLVFNLGPEAGTYIRREADQL